MGINLVDSTKWGVRYRRSKRGLRLWHWRLVDRHGRTQLIPVARGIGDSGFETRDKAARHCKACVNALGGDYRDLDRQDED